MSMHKQMIGKVGPGSSDVTLGDYINRKQQQAAFEQVAQEKKLTFDEWFEKEYCNVKWFDKSLKQAMHRRLFKCWRVAQENK